MHVPFCDGKCPYCAFYSTLYSPDRAARFLDALERELKSAPAFEAETVYIGGGTPTVLSERELAWLCGLVRGRVCTERVQEWTCEANPGAWNLARLAVLAEAGVTRISLGAQSFDEVVLRTLGRRHTVSDIRTAVADIRAAGFMNFGLDLIAGVPGVPRTTWHETLREAVALGAPHVSVYALTVEENARLPRDIARGTARAPCEQDQLSALALAEDTLGAAGYRRYEISNYAQPGFECRHNLACWHGERYLGFGPAAASHRGLDRWTNAPDLAAYCAALAAGKTPPRETERLTPALKRSEQIIFGLRTAEGVVMRPDERVPLRRLARLREDGLVADEAGRWFLTARGRRLADYVAVELLD
ncbi:MAG: radical SAM family heme chaperone HemW [Kiritimatiellae bacterium]|nr:radical SAM family heme chaperone HemW [Kiritimatiellia bacterium]